MSQQQDPYSQLRQRLGGAAPGRLNKRTARLSQAEVDENTDLETAQETFLDPATQRFVTLEKSTHYFLACGCRFVAPTQVRGICPACARSLRVRMFKRMRLVCNDHVVCMRCRARRRRQCQGGGFWRTLITLLMWPLFDVESGGDDTPPPPPPYPPYPPYPPCAPSRPGNPRSGGPHAGPY